MSLAEKSLSESFLVCPPDYFDVTYEINAWMDIDHRPDHELAISQWHNYFSILSKVASAVHLLPPHPGVPDLVFTANHALVRGRKAFLALMKTPERRLEQKFYTEWFEDNGFETSLPTKGSYEGEGDSFLIEDTLLYSLGYRSDAAVAEEIKEFFDLKKIIFVELTSPYFYHLDTCLAPIGESRLLVYPEAISKKSLQELGDNFELITASEEEAMRFCCNAVVCKRDIILPEGCPDVNTKLEKLGFSIHTCNLDQFLRSGGASKCLCLKLWN